jgi:dTDP-4-amino-4,6-dideoxygalactose transaminase
VGSPNYTVPFHRPTRTPGDDTSVARALAEGALSGDGPYTAAVEALLAEQLAVPRVLLTPSGTAALELAVLALGLGPGDEVIVPSFAFPSTANAAALRGAQVVFAEVQEATLNLDVAHAASLVTERTRAVVPIHYGGIASGLDDLMDLAATHDLAIIEDAAHALFGTWKGQPLGSFGQAGAFSFHGTKNVTCGEGGALALTDEATVVAAEIMREKGTDRARFLRGEVDRYTWVELGSSYVLAEPLAAMLQNQLLGAADVQGARAAVWHRYADGLSGWADEVGANVACIPPGAGPAWHNFWLLVADPAQRDPMLAHLAARGVQATFHFQPLHRSVMGERLAVRPAPLPVTDAVAGRLVRLPFFTDLAPSEQDLVIEAVAAFRP